MQCTMGKKYTDKFKRKCLKEFGWYAVCVEYDTECPNEFNYTTHGIQENFGHLDFQICFRLDEKLCHHFMIKLVEEIKLGNKFLPDLLYMGIINDYPAKFIEAWENGRKVLRLLIPNKNGNYTGPYFFSTVNSNTSETIVFSCDSSLVYPPISMGGVFKKPTYEMLKMQCTYTGTKLYRPPYP